MTTYKSIVLRGPGGLDRLELTDTPLEDPRPGEVRVRVLRCGVGFTDVLMRVGYYPYRPRFPFVPGYEIVGVVDAVGEGVDSLREGTTVAALTVHGGYAEYLVREAKHLVPVPEGVDPNEAVCLVLNYVTATQMLHRVARVEGGETALVTAAAGGVGSALLELGRRERVRMLGAASSLKHGLVRELGATPVDYRTEGLVGPVRAAHPEGVDLVFDALGGRWAGECFAALRKGGLYVRYGNTVAAASGLGALASTAWFFLRALLSGRQGHFYGITEQYRRDPQPFREDLRRLLWLLANGELRPRIADVLPLSQAARAQSLVEKGQVMGKLILDCTRID